MNANLKSMLTAIEAWPLEDQEQLAEAARDIEARRVGHYLATEDELEAIDAGLADLRAGRLASAEAVQAMHARLRSA